MSWVCVRCVEPGKGVDVNVYCADTREQFVAFSLGDGRFQFAVDENGKAICCRPTHWAPLKEPPSEKIGYFFEDLKLDHA